MPWHWAAYCFSAVAAAAEAAAGAVLVSAVGECSSCADRYLKIRPSWYKPVAAMKTFTVMRFQLTGVITIAYLRVEMSMNT